MARPEFQLNARPRDHDFNERYPMKYLFTALMLFCLSYSSGSSATPLFVYNHGYVMGELNKIDLIGLNRRVVTGEVSIGNNRHLQLQKGRFYGN